jgi:hypothetical protein
MDSTMWLLVATVVVNGLLAGASLDQSIKQLPARRRIGIVAYSAYSQAGDLGNGVIWYATLGVGGALLSLVTCAVALTQRLSGQASAAVWLLIALTIAHSVMTALAAPTNFSQRRAGEDPEQLTAIFARFERLQTIRATLQALTLLAAAWALVARIKGM